ncbi:MAG: sulfite oxidase [Thermoplasmata archaeon]|nr:sulfite oxidase [Thermoplasmata archaeon]
MAPALLQLVSNSNAEKHGIKIYADGVLKGKHHLYAIVDGPNEESVRKYFAPLGMLGSLDVAPASRCEEVVAQGHC